MKKADAPVIVDRPEYGIYFAILKRWYTLSSGEVFHTSSRSMAAAQLKQNGMQDNPAIVIKTFDEVSQ